jgi:hypothetical protein
MSGFIDHLILRHAAGEKTISPRLPGKFEPFIMPIKNPWRGENELIETTAPDFDMPGTPNRKDIVTNFATDTNLGSTQPGITSEPSETDKGQDQRKMFTLENNNASFFDQKSIGQDREQSRFDLFQKEIKDHAPIDIMAGVQNINDRSTDPAPFPGITNGKNQIESVQSLQKLPEINPSLMNPAAVKHKSGKEFKATEVQKKFRVMPAKQNAPGTLQPGLRNPEQTSAGHTIIKISIGRIEVKAISSTKADKKTGDTKIPKPKMSLEDYLQKRNTSKS